MKGNSFISVAEEVLDGNKVEEKALAYGTMSSSSFNNSFYGVNFVIPEKKELILGWQVDSRPEHSEFRVKEVQLLYFGLPESSGIENIAIEDEDAESELNSPVEIYSLQGFPLNAVPQSGLYILKQGKKISKIMKR